MKTELKGTIRGNKDLRRENAELFVNISHSDNKQAVHGITRAMLGQLEENMGKKIADEATALLWLMCHVSWAHQRQAPTNKETQFMRGALQEFKERRAGKQTKVKS